ncbi:TPA: thioredoxin family protein, partial [Enterococcus faecium]|nr:thioredoxin family protein [Enterococcus faecium]HAP9070446.1 thioredoxin family protein [Enterococcus faecium]HCR4142796.1 thioredoxin family protein [Enterococcus faecium]
KKTIFVLAIFICFGLLLVGYLLFNSNEMRTISTNDLLKKSELKDKKKESLAFIMFTQEECEYCIAINPIIDSVNKETLNKIKKYDISVDFQSKQKCKIKFVPTIVAYSKNKEVGRIDNELDNLYRKKQDGSIVIDKKKTKTLLIDWMKKMDKQGEYLYGED